MSEEKNNNENSEGFDIVGMFNQFQRLSPEQIVRLQQEAAGILSTRNHTELKSSEIEFLTFLARDIGITQDSLPTSILRIIQRACDTYEVPTIRNIAEDYINYKLEECPCLEVISVDQAAGSLVHLWKKISAIEITCGSILLTAEYFESSGRDRLYPEQDELLLFAENRAHVHSEPDDYCNNKKHHVPTPGLENLKPFSIQHNDVACSICCEDIVKNSSVFELPQCHHIFHADPHECLGEKSSILTWLEKSRFCPNCNASISVEKKRQHNSDEFTSNKKAKH